MKTKCNGCYYLTESGSCSFHVLDKVKNTITYEGNHKPIIQNYKCLYAFPKTIYDNISSAITYEDIEKLRKEKLPKIHLSVVVDCFGQANQAIQYQKTIEDIQNIIQKHQELIIQDIVVLMSSEREDKEHYIDYFKENIGVKWKLCAMRVCLNHCHKILFAMDNITSKVLIYLKPACDTKQIENVIHKLVDISLLQQSPFITITNNSDLSTELDIACFNLTNFSLLKKNNLNENDTQQDPLLFQNWIDRGKAQELVINV